MAEARVHPDVRDKVVAAVMADYEPEYDEQAYEADELLDDLCSQRQMVLDDLMGWKDYR